ncbi:uncharacterized membrane protein YhaH (DUF805 family) [Agromyces sp. 3263]|uniref:hypothetical protein n=1 Tax=Agromyces sp. 3263 TaxID=2817750 RepID=UPI00285F72A7|nr:hypothetical protein [Agromyces sp. 3263]MDR6904808.1 uncharacterized membrane protein YhaH (DUF805 family) [Agromyces sp. 3263]
MIGTFVLFLIGPYSVQAENLALEVLFIASACLAFGAGYRLSIKQKRSYRAPASREASSAQKWLVFLACVWYLTFSAASLAEYGATSLGSIVEAALNPGDSYFHKFAVYADQERTGRVNLAIQLTVLAGALYAVLIPMTVWFWRSLGLFLRALAVLSVIAYLMYFLYIGTLKGFGDVLIALLAALAASFDPQRLSSRSITPSFAPSSRMSPPGRQAQHRRRRYWAVLALLGVSFVVLMSNIQADRLEGLGAAGQFSPDPVISQMFGERFALGLAVTLYYPVNGYIGLSKSLETPFEFSGGASVPALASYKVQYFGGDDPMELSYPARTEERTGWPAGQVWSTFFPWIASDVTFPGAVVFMAIFGWFLARCWMGVRRERDALSLILFCQLMIAAIYIPANNQLMLSRYTAIGFVTLIAIYLVRAFVRPTLDARGYRLLPVRGDIT